ncbi:MAG TPA: hypothetical protein VN133_03635 [Humibacter sp.]|nr:hypothetical protein [Humibacter sp.]
MISKLELEVLRDGLDDWVPLLAIDGMGRQLTSNPREIVVAAVLNLVVNRFVAIGIIESHQFAPWEGEYEQLETRLRDIYHHREERGWGFEFWLNNTPLGDERANQSLSHRNADND